MVESAIVTGELATARHLVEFLEKEGFGLECAVWAVDDEGEGRLYLVPSQQNETNLKQTIRVAHTMSAHKDELPDRHDLRYSVVDSTHPVIQAVRSASAVAGKVRGIYKDGTYIDTAYVLRPAA